jgi:hypothetical protein
MIKNKDNFLFVHFPTVLTLSILSFFLIFRSFFGIGLNDEMQYYHQILGLLDNDKLFTNDLYIQQLVYVIFYPIFKPYYLIFGESGLILYGRIVFSILLLFVYELSRRQFLRMGCKKLDAGVCAIALVLVIPYHGIYALSYNTVSQICWTLTAIFVIFRMSLPIWLWSVIITISTIAHPIGGLAIGTVCVYHHLTFSLITKSIKIILLSTVLVILTLVGVIVLSVDSDTLLQAFNFTRGYSVGVAIFKSSQVMQMMVIVFCVVLATTITARSEFTQLAIIGNIFLLILFLCYILNLSVGSVSGYFWPSSYSTPILGFWVGIFCVSIYALRCVDQNNYGGNLKLSTLILLVSMQAITLAGTSSNGVIQSVGAFSMFVPIINASISMNSSYQKTWLLSRFVNLLVMLVACSISICLPYGQDPLYRHDRNLSSLPIFSGLYLPNEQLEFFSDIKDSIGPFANKNEGLIFSKIPAVYSILGVKPTTCMIYNHSLGSIMAQETFLECVLNKKIDLIIKIGEWGVLDEKVGNLIETIALNNKLVCLTPENVSVLEKYGGSDDLRLTVCTKKN